MFAKKYQSKLCGYISNRSMGLLYIFSRFHYLQVFVFQKNQLDFVCFQVHALRFGRWLFKQSWVKILFKNSLISSFICWIKSSYIKTLCNKNFQKISFPATYFYDIRCSQATANYFRYIFQMSLKYFTYSLLS